MASPKDKWIYVQKWKREEETFFIKWSEVIVVYYDKSQESFILETKNMKYIVMNILKEQPKPDEAIEAIKCFIKLMDEIDSYKFRNAFKLYDLIVEKRQELENEIVAT